MRDLLLILVLILIAALGQIIVNRIGAFLEGNYRRSLDLPHQSNTVYVRFSEGKSGEDLSSEISKLQDAHMQCTVIVCKDSDAEIIEYLRNEGCAVNYK